MRFTRRTDTSWRLDSARPPAVAGRFYPGRPAALADAVDQYVANARQRVAPESATSRLLAVAVPHAGYVYSGPTAGYAYSLLDRHVRRVVLLGPAHYVAVAGLGLSTAPAWQTPLGEVPLDAGSAADLAAMYPWIRPADAAHAPEHSLEVQLPFLQRVLEPGWELVPLIVGRPDPDEVAVVLTEALSWPETVVVISTDLSHYLPYEQARTVDAATLGNVLGGRADRVTDSDACGAYGLRGMVTAADSAGWVPQLLDARNSGDTAGDHSRVVGYAAVAWFAPADATPSPDPATVAAQSDLAAMAPQVSPAARAALLRLARDTIEATLARTARPDWHDVAAVGPECAADGAAFVTLRSAGGELLGCIGSLAARQPLARDVADHAYDAAFRDPRFPPLDHTRAHGMRIDISVLGPSRPYPASGYDNLVAHVEPGTGLVVEAGRHRATFLPAVWESLPEPAAFVAALWRKAGLRPGEWPRGIALEAYAVTEFAEEQADPGH